MRALSPYESNLGGISFSFYHFFKRQGERCDEGRCNFDRGGGWDGSIKEGGSCISMAISWLLFVLQAVDCVGLFVVEDPPFLPTVCLLPSTRFSTHGLHVCSFSVFSP